MGNPPLVQIEFFGDIVAVVRNKSNTLVAAEELRAMIFTGELAADSNHLENELAELLKMSRTPVREACLMLAGEGLLMVQPRKGVRINSISLVDMSEIYEALTELESYSACCAAQAGYSADDLANLNEYITQMSDALEEMDLNKWSRSDEAFHSELVDLGGNSHIKRVVQNFNVRVRRARNLTLHIRPVPMQSNADHRAVYEAILKGESEAAQAIHRQHRIAAGKLLVGLLEQHGFGRV